MLLWSKIKSAIYQLIIFFSIIYFILGIIGIPAGRLGSLERFIFIFSVFVMLHLTYKIGKEVGHDELLKKLKSDKFFNKLKIWRTFTSQDEPKN